jgi:hypothetical protein
VDPADVEVRRQLGFEGDDLEDVLGNGIVKECKASWNATKPDKFLARMHPVEERGLLGPGMKMHYAIPKGQRGPLDRKFESIGKDKMRGRIQEH